MATVQRLGGATGGFPSGYNNDDNTGMNQTWDYQAPAYAATLAILTTCGNTIVQLALTGNITITAGVGTSTTAPYVGDRLIIMSSNNTNTWTLTFSTGLSYVTSTQSNTSGKYSRIEFEFNGTTWVEVCRSTSA